jgi:hypothetical protein
MQFALISASLHNSSCITAALTLAVSVFTAVVCVRSHVCGDLQLVTLIGDRLRSFVPESSIIAAATRSQTLPLSQQHSILSSSTIDTSVQHSVSVSGVHSTTNSDVNGSASNPFKHSAVLAGLAMSVLAVAIDGDSECQQALLQRFMHYYTILCYASTHACSTLCSL